MHGYGFSHCDGEIRPKQKKTIDISKYVKPRMIQTSFENGAINEKVDGACLRGILYRIAMPKFMIDGVKSIALIRSEVTVKSVIAISALCTGNKKKKKQKPEKE